MNGIIPVQSNLGKQKTFSSSWLSEVPGEVGVVKHVVAVNPQICVGEINLSHVDSLQVGQINISPVPHNKFELKPLGDIDGYGQQRAGEDVDHQMNPRGVAANNNNIISGIISENSENFIKLITATLPWWNFGKFFQFIWMRLCFVKYLFFWFT